MGTIESIQNQTVFDLVDEILVVGLDESSIIVYTHKVRLISTTIPVCAAKARNLGVQEAKGEWLYFIDADCIARPDSLERMLQHTATYKVVGGGVTFPMDQYWQLVTNVSGFHEFLSTKPPQIAMYLPTLNLLVHKQVYNLVGLMDEALPKGEDIDWTRRLAGRSILLYFEPQAYVIHLPLRISARKVWQNSWQSGYFMAKVRISHSKSYKQSNWLLNPVMLRWGMLPISFIATLRIFFDRSNWKYLHILIPITGTKLVWCLGALYYVTTHQPNISTKMEATI